MQVWSAVRPPSGSSAPSGRTLAVAATAAALIVGLSARGAAAQVALEEEEGAPPPPPPEAVATEKARIGLGIRMRNVRIPRSLLEVFVERAAGGSSNLGLGLELLRRKGNFEFQFGVEYEKIFITAGQWIDKGDMIPQDEADFVEFEDFGWVTAEATFLYHSEITPQFALRYGGGAGIGVLFGDIVRTDQVCTTTSVDSCNEKPGAENVKTPYDSVPPVMLVVNAIFGVQIRPTDSIFINIEGGLRTMPFFGATAGYYF
jgi:hypothetical protein